MKFRLALYQLGHHLASFLQIPQRLVQGHSVYLVLGDFHIAAECFGTAWVEFHAKSMLVVFMVEDIIVRVGVKSFGSQQNPVFVYNSELVACAADQKILLFVGCCVVCRG